MLYFLESHLRPPYHCTPPSSNLGTKYNVDKNADFQQQCLKWTWPVREM